MPLQARAVLRLLLAAVTIHPATAGGQEVVTDPGVELSIAGRLHTQLAVSSVEGAVDDVFFRRARLTFDAVLTDRLSVRIEPEFSSGEGKIWDGWVQLALEPGMRLTVGQFKRPFSLFFLASSLDLSVIERTGRIEGVDRCAGVGGVCSLTTLLQGLQLSDRDVGVLLEDEGERLRWAVSLTNGTGANVGDENDAKSFSGRLAVAVGRGWQVAGQVAVHDHLDPTGRTSFAPAWSVDAQYGDWRDGLLVQAALAGGENWRITGGGAWFLAGQVVASVHRPVGEGEGLVEAVEPLLRVSVADPDTGPGGDGGAVLTPGFMVYVEGRNKVGVNLDAYLPETGSAEFSLKLQTFFHF
jgi:hypothetical protein